MLKLSLSSPEANLRRGYVDSVPRDIAEEVRCTCPTIALPSVQPVTSYQMALLPAMMANLQFGLYQLVAEFLKGMMSSRVEPLYSYLMAWFVMHCPILIECPKEASPPFVQWLLV